MFRPGRGGRRSWALFHVGTALLLTCTAGSALAHPGHEGSAAEIETWFVYGPVLFGGVAIVTAAGLSQEAVISRESALVTAAIGVVLLGVGLFQWVA